VRTYYAATLLFVIADIVFGINIRLAFLETVPAWRAAYYVLCIALYAVMVWRPSAERIFAFVESTFTVSALILSMAMRTLVVPLDMIEQGRTPVSVAEILNFLLAGGMAYLSFSTVARAMAVSEQRRRD